MTKKTLNQNPKYIKELINYIDTGFVFNDKPINRFNFIKKKENNSNRDKIQELSDLKKKN